MKSIESEGTGLTRISWGCSSIFFPAGQQEQRPREERQRGGYSGPVALRTLFAPLLQPLTYGERTDCRQSEDVPRYQTMA